MPKTTFQQEQNYYLYVTRVELHRFIQMSLINFLLIWRGNHVALHAILYLGLVVHGPEVYSLDGLCFIFIIMFDFIFVV